MLRNAIYGGWVVVTTSSRSYNLAVRGKHRENGACRREMHAKKVPNKVHNHAMALDDDVRSYSIQLAAIRIETVLCDCTKLSY